MGENRRWRNKGFGMKPRIDGPVQAINQEGERLAEGPALGCAVPRPSAISITRAVMRMKIRVNSV